MERERTLSGVNSATPAVTVRPAVEADLPAIQAIYNDAILTGVATWDLEPWSDEQRRRWFDEHDAGQPVFVVEVEGAFAGFAYLSLLSGRGGYRFTRENTIYLAEEWRGRGVGKVLLAALLDEARRLGVRLVVAKIESSNAASITLHHGLGYEVAGELRNAGYKFDAWRSVTYMTLDLGDPLRR